MGRLSILFILATTLFTISCSKKIVDSTDQSIQVLDSIAIDVPVVSLKSVEIDNHFYIYIAGEGNDLISYEVKNDKLYHLETYAINSVFGGVRAINKIILNNKPYLIVGNKADNALELFAVLPNGKISFVSRFNNDDSVFLKEIITTEIIKIDGDYFVYVGGLDTGISGFKITENGFEFINSIADTELTHLDGIIGMRSLNIQEVNYLYVGGFFDDGISTFKIKSNGELVNISNIHNSKDLFLNGAFAVDAIPFKNRSYVLVGHRHKAHYDSYREGNTEHYNGDGINVFDVNTDGNLKLYKTISSSDAIKLKGNTRIEHFFVEDKALIAVASREDTGVQFLTIDPNGQIDIGSYIDLGFEVYNGMDILNYNGNRYISVAGYDKLQLKLLKF